MECGKCGRKFSELALGKHIEFCGVVNGKDRFGSYGHYVTGTPAAVHGGPKLKRPVAATGRDGFQNRGMREVVRDSECLEDEDIDLQEVMREYIRESTIISRYGSESPPSPRIWFEQSLTKPRPLHVPILSQTPRPKSAELSISTTSPKRISRHLRIKNNGVAVSKSWLYYGMARDSTQYKHIHIIEIILNANRKILKEPSNVNCTCGG